VGIPKINEAAAAMQELQVDPPIHAHSKMRCMDLSMWWREVRVTPLDSA